MTAPLPPRPDATRPGQESVWDYPRPPRLEEIADELEIWLNGRRIAWTTAALRIVETAHPPMYLFPTRDVDWSVLRYSAIEPIACPFKGDARFLDVLVPGPDGAISAPAAAFLYESPTPSFASIADYVSYYCGPMDACLVNGEAATPQPGAFYSGWITAGVAGPFKGFAGTEHW